MPTGTRSPSSAVSNEYCKVAIFLMASCSMRRSSWPAEASTKPSAVRFNITSAKLSASFSDTVGKARRHNADRQCPFLIFRGGKTGFAKARANQSPGGLYIRVYMATKNVQRTRVHILTTMQGARSLKAIYILTLFRHRMVVWSARASSWP